ncbi:MAG: hypothetical protein Q4D34_03830 [Eggerthellaceae bacterium]|nr:hypothetical protein [Eggerthellaceae bacterium]
MERALDYYMKGLSIDARQHLFMYFKMEISDMMIKCILERDDGYPSFRSCGYTDDNIAKICETYSERFRYPNDFMEKHDRPPLFTDPNNAYISSREYVEIWKIRSAEELEDIFGCSYADYTPKARES